MINDGIGKEKNSYPRVVLDTKSVPHVCFFANKDIQIGEEIRYDYGVTNLPWRKVSTVISCSLNVL